MRNLKVTLEYDGRGFRGWQVQPGQRTIQGELYDAFCQMGDPEGLRITGAGRTDAGVHAVGQVASVLTTAVHSPEIMVKGLNGKLPRDIIVRAVEEVPLSFNARYDAKSRSYRYVFIRKPTAIWRGYYYQVKGDLDIEEMRRALHSIRGERDFASFATTGDVPSTRCDLLEADLVESGPLLTVSLRADHFLYNMIRTLAGTLLRIGRGSGEDILEILDRRDRAAAGPVLPPYALYFMEVEY
ncbi:MAG TPA: tRNA pseudouridine(38-40) synthase TruA [Candidatus Krumholzibacterium sp.]|nr:tRNA pseudouridine(38-40) synthase TruA [Candidatus Krumholzibacterium sp.]